jgi:2-polyprenyl-3-methyl-5-hydroxy-6-metoxy-1,4-benzoquinol methylase
MVKLAKNVALAISKQITLTPEMEVMDSNCVTGLLTFELQALVRSITDVDNSRGMLDVFNAKIAKLKLNNVASIHADLDSGDKLTGEYNIVVSNMTLHHVKEIEPLFLNFIILLNQVFIFVFPTWIWTEVSFMKTIQGYFIVDLACLFAQCFHYNGV